MLYFLWTCFAILYLAIGAYFYLELDEVQEPFSKLGRAKHIIVLVILMGFWPVAIGGGLAGYWYSTLNQEQTVRFWRYVFIGGVLLLLGIYGPRLRQILGPCEQNEQLRDGLQQSVILRTPTRYIYQYGRSQKRA